jgi:D-alanyl-D-alanine carboxypeptidase
LEELDEGSSTKKGVCLVEIAKNSFLSMIDDAEEDGYSIKASSAFRTYETQKILFNNAVNSGKADALISLAKPGYSEHQLGTTVDVTSSSIDYASASGDFYKTPESDWLKENAYLYGFIQSYPLGKESITGYKSEPWHYRYLGIEKAKEIKDSGLTITEFLK